MSRPKHERSDSADAFIPESAQISGTSDDLAELLAEQYLREASGDESEEGARDDVVSEEVGGPFVESGPGEEYGSTRKAAENDDAHTDTARRTVEGPTRNPTPQAVAPLAIAAPDENADDGTVETDLNEFPLTASDARQARLEAQPVSRMEPDVEIDRPSAR